MNNISYVIIACYPDKGMKSYGSKSLLEFSKKKLLQHQIDCIKGIGGHKNYEIIVISDFETNKLQKYFGDQIKIIPLENHNPVYTGCKASKYDHAIFIDYGCVFNKRIITNINKESCVIVNNNKNSKLEIGCVIEDRKIKHIFFDLPDNKFCNIFSLSNGDKNKILHTDGFDYFNLLSFEIINMLLDSGSIFKVHDIKNEDFLFFNHMRQKNAVNKFIKKIPN